MGIRFWSRAAWARYIWPWLWRRWEFGRDRRLISHGARSGDGPGAGLSGRTGWNRRTRIYLAPEGTVIDETGYLPLDDMGATDFFQLVESIGIFG